MKLTEEQKLIQQTAKEFAQEQIWPQSSCWDNKSEFPREIIKTLGELGFMGMMVPPQWGGAGVDVISYLLALREIAAGDASCATIMSVNNSVVCLPLLAYGTEAQKQQFLIPLAQGQQLGAFCLTEPQAGSDAASLSTQAMQKQDTYVLTGTKQFVTSGKNADIALVFATTDPALGKKGVSAFIVPTNTPGYHVSHLEEKMGQKASDTAQIVLDECVIPADYLLGKLGEGYKIALSHLEGGRLGIAAQSIGIAQQAFSLALAYTKERETFGKLLAEHETIRHYLADMATHIEAAWALLMQAALQYEAGEPALQQACMAKLFASQMAEKVCSQALQIFGGYGYLKEYRIEQLCRDVRVTQIYEGTNEIQKMIIAREIMKE